MTSWQFDERAMQSFLQLSTMTQRQLVKWLDEHMESTESLKKWGEELRGQQQSLWRYQIGKFRLVVSIEQDDFVVVAILMNV